MLLPGLHKGSSAALGPTVTLVRTFPHHEMRAALLCSHLVDISIVWGKPCKHCKPHPKVILSFLLSTGQGA